MARTHRSGTVLTRLYGMDNQLEHRISGLFEFPGEGSAITPESRFLDRISMRE